jgi:DNA modification methylase
MGDTYVGGHIGGSIYNKEWYISSTDAIPQIKQGRPQSRVKDIPEKSLMMLPERFAIAMIEQGWILRNKIIWFKSNGMPSSVKDRFTNKWEYIFFFVKSRKYYFDLDAVRVPLKQSSIKRIKQNVIDQFVDTKVSDFPDQNMNIKNILLHMHSKYLKDRMPNGSLAGRVLRNVADGKLETFVREAITNVNQYLKDKLKESGLTVKQLAEMTGKKETMIAHYFRTDLSGASLPTREFWDKAKDILKLEEYDKYINEQYKSVLPSFDKGANPGDVIPYHPKGDPTFGMRLPPQPWQEHAFNPNGANPGDFMDVPTRPHSFAHFAVYPVTLIAPLIKVGCPPGGVVLDPFAGSGTTGVVAEILNRNSILIEISAEYIDIINWRLKPENLEKDRDVIMKSGKNGSDDR